jgi:small-conductance mechanosensitive channel
MKILEKVYFNNTMLQYLIATGLFVLLILILRVLKYVFLRRFKRWSKKTETKLDDFIVSAIEKSVLPLLYFAAFFVSINTLHLSEKFDKFLHAASVVVITFFTLRLVTTTIRYAIHTRMIKKEDGDSKLKQIRGIMIIINVVVWILGLIFLLDNFGYDITAFITGLGIGGIAIALAAQNILGDLFNYFVIFFDRPFEVGDFIIVDDKLGTVEAIGIKTSRIRSLSGEELVFANSDLTSSRIHNYKRMQKRRILFSFGVTYQTTIENLRLIPEIIKGIIINQEDTEFDRAHFQKFGDFSLDFQIVYYILTSDYNRYMDIQQSINLSICEEFAKRGIEFAYPTQTVYMEKE